MRQKLWLINLVLIATLLVLGFNNCGRIAFRDENPSREKSTQTDNTVVGNPMRSATKELLTKVCSVLTRCHTQLTTEQCESGVLASRGIDYQIGLPKATYATFADVIKAEEDGRLSSSGTATDTCSTTIDALTCAESSVQSAFDAAATDPFAKLALMIPTSPGSCPAVFSQPPERKDYYVATTGSDSNDGSAEKPWATITHAAQTIVPGAEGAIVHVAPGTYGAEYGTAACPANVSPCGIYTAKSGTAAAPIIYISDQQWGAKIVPSGMYTLWYNSGNHVKVIGFEMGGTAGTNFGLLSESAFTQVIGNHIRDIPVTQGCAKIQAGGGIFFGFDSTAHDNDALGNIIHDIGPSLANGLAASNYCNQAHGITINQPRGRIENNIIYRVGTWGIATWRSAANLNITHNLVFNSGSRDSAGKMLGGGINISAQNGVGVHEGTTIANNIFRNNTGHALNEFGSVGANTYVNNSLFANGLNLNMLTGAPSGSITSDPLMVDFKIDGGGNYRLQASSPLIDAASSVCSPATGNGNCAPTDDFTGFARPYGSGADIGPFESR